MQCVILAAGKGTRMRPLTETMPKPLISVAGKPILQHSIESLPAVIDEVVIVVSYLKEQIMDFLGSKYMGKKITYCEQVNPAGGTGDALMCTKDVVKGKFLFLNGDDIYGKDGLAKAVTYDHMIFGYRSDFPERFGVLVPNADGTLKGIIEKPENPPSNHINIGGYVLNDSIFAYDVPLSASGELYMTDIVTAYAQDYPVHIVEQSLWIPIGYPEDIPKAEAILAEMG